MRVYFDENFSHRLVSGIREFQSGKPSEKITVIHCPDDFGRGCSDEDWIPKVAARHGVVLTQDQNIHRVRAQWELFQQNKIGLFFFKPPQGGWGYWSLVAEVVRRWGTIKDLATKERPFGFVIDPKKTKITRL